MSYILDALRKSERERKLAQAASLDSMVFSPEPVHKRPWLLWSLGAIAVVNVAALGYFLGLNTGTPQEHPAATAQSPVTPTPNTPAQAAGAVVAPPPTIAPAVPPPAPVPVPAKPVTAPPPPAALPTHKGPDTEALDAAEEEDTGEENAADETMEPEEPEEDSETAAPPPRAPAPLKQNAVPLLSDMPPAFQSRVPQLKINLYAYGANPDERFVVINMSRQSIGAMVADGVRLERIDEDSLTLSFEGQRFRIERP